MSSLRSLSIWLVSLLLILFWVPLLAVIRLFDRDPIVYRTGRWFRRLGVAMTRVNPFWQLRLSGLPVENPRNPYVVVSNHQSYADIPILSNLPWEMKWVGKVELFRLPVIGWMMAMAKDIKVDRSSSRSGAMAMLQAKRTLEHKCSVIFFPEGTRSEDGLVKAFSNGPFHLAVKMGIPILPVAVEGSYRCLPKKSWKFGKPEEILVAVLPPVPTHPYAEGTVSELREEVRRRIIQQIAEWRGVPAESVDKTAVGATTS
ncbi:MAG: 1-acyl-sn-glycerol-3-phosphate acyltransferase [Ignavibacteria bacterium]|nr:1-acyl-sn-glycerol-3-phosphate acyltransferase [Ignavibacteria bacterium]